MVIVTAVMLCARESPAASDQLAEESWPLSVLTLGTSLTANYQWPHELGKSLAQCFGATLDIEIKARAGANSSQGAQQFMSRRMRYPDIVLVEFAANDSNLMNGVDLAVSRRNHESLLALIRETSPRSKIVLMIMGPAFGLRGLIRPSLSNYHAMYSSLAVGSDMALIDLTVSWERLLSTAAYKELYPDGLHPTQSAASQVVIPAIRNKISELLKLNSPKDCGHNL